MNALTTLLVTATVAASGFARPQQAPPPPQPKSAQPQQQAPRDQRVPRSGTGVIRGRVIAGDTGEPLRRARLVLSAPALDKARFAATDAQGRYEFRDLPASRFVLTASKTGFVTLQLGQRRAFEPGTPFDLADKQFLEAVDIALPRGAVIAGRVTDDLGEPVPGVRVSAMRLRYQAGSRQPVAVGRSVETDDRGEYRLFGLAPGSYYVGVSSALFGETLTFGSAYYPGTSSPAEAEQITIKLGQTRGGVDVSLPLARLVHLSGVVVDARGSPLVDATVRALSAGATASYGGVVRADGTFTIAGVPQGEYSLTASGRNAETSRSDYGVIAVSALSGDVAGLVITTTAGSRLTGRITFDGDSAPPFLPTAISLLAEPVNARSSAGGPVGTIRGDWSFELTGQFGARLIRVEGLPPRWALKSVLLDGRDITDTPLEVAGTTDISGLRVVLTSRVTTVSGRVTDKGGKLVRDCSVVVFPEDAARWTDRSRFVATVRPDLNGRFEVTGLPPSAYLIVALEYVEDGAWGDPEFLESLRVHATKLALVEDEKKTVDLRLGRM